MLSHQPLLQKHSNTQITSWNLFLKFESRQNGERSEDAKLGLNFSVVQHTAWITLKMSLNSSEKRQAHEEKEQKYQQMDVESKESAFQRHGAHHRFISPLTSDVCLCVNKIHLILSLIRQQVYQRICPLTSDCAVKETQSDRSVQYAVVCSGTRKGSSNSNCSASPLPAPTDSHKILCNALCHIQAC